RHCRRRRDRRGSRPGGVAGPCPTVPEPDRGIVPWVREPARRGRQHRGQRRGGDHRLRSVERMTDPRRVSFWLDSLPVDHSFVQRPSLPGDVTADVAIVGAGYTGLWTADYTQQNGPGLAV